MLQEGVISALGAIEFPEGLNVPNDVIVTLIRHDFNASNFDKLNTELRIIESTAEYKGIKPDGARAFTLLIMWCEYA